MITPKERYSLESCAGREINSIGSIRQLILDYPRGHGISARDIIDTLSGEVDAAYRALEAVFISRVNEVSKSVFGSIYDCLQAGLKAHHGDERGQELFRQCWCGIADGKFSTYFYCGESLRLTAARLKEASRQHDSRSPYNMLCSLVVQPFPFETTFARKAIATKGVLHSPWIKARYIDVAQDAYAAELALYDSADLTVYACALKDEAILSVACPRPIANDVIPEVKKMRYTLHRQLAQGLPDWSPYIVRMQGVATRTLHLQQNYR